MYIAFFRGPGDWITHLIRAYSQGPYSHAVLVFSDGISFSASGRRKPAVNFWQIDFWPWWDLVYFRATPEQEQAIRSHAEQFIGARFDWRGLLSFAFPWLGTSPGHWYCTALIMLLVHDAGLLLDVPSRVTPNDLYRLLKP